MGSAHHRPPLLVLLPGLDGFGTTSGPFVQCLGPRLRTHCVTYPPTPYLTRTELARHVLDQWPVCSEPIILLGESFSTAVAVQLALARPSQLAGLVLVTPSFANRPRWSVRTLARGYPSWLPAFAPPGFALRWLLLNGRNDEPAAQLLRGVARSDSRVVLSRLKEYLGHPTADDPAEVAVPVRAIRAQRDRLLKSGTPTLRAGLEWLEADASHLVLADAPARAAEVVADFAATLSRHRNSFPAG